MAADDKPVYFGYKMSWLAVHTADSRDLIDALGLLEPQPASWEKGIEAVYEDRRGDYAFISPPVNGWTLVVGHLMGGWGEGVEGIERLLKKLSSHFGEAQAFSTHRIVEAHHWILARDGKLVRSYGYVGSEFQVYADSGSLTPVEQTIGINLDVPEVYDVWKDYGEDKFRPPREQDVMTVAGAWSVDPSQLDEETHAPGPGILAKVPDTFGA